MAHRSEQQGSVKYATRRGAISCLGWGGRCGLLGLLRACVLLGLGMVLAQATTATTLNVNQTIPLNSAAASSPFLIFPLPNRSPGTAVINSIFDHYMITPYATGGVQDTAYTGESGRAECGQDPTFPRGFKKYDPINNTCRPGETFNINGHYSGGMYLYYDNHPGYDYRTTDQSADGKVAVLAAASGMTRTTGSGCSVTNLPDFGAVMIFHDPPNDEYATCYLHLSSIMVGDGVHVNKGMRIGTSGDVGAPGNPHLHFEVRKKVSETYVAVDPYGWQGQGTDPYNTLNPTYPANINVNLWLSATPQLTLSLNQTTFHKGDQLILNAKVTPGSTQTIVDAYVAVQLPDTTLLFLRGDGGFTTEIKPIVSNWTIASFNGEIFRYIFNGTEPKGTYAWLAAFTQPGTLNIIGDIAQAPFTFNLEAPHLIQTGDMVVPRTLHTATLLNDGRVLIAGGVTRNTSDNLASAEIYDPSTGTFSRTGSMHLQRWGHSAVRLDDGRVLIVGGWITSFITAAALAEIYDPATGLFNLTGSMSTPRADFPPSSKLSDGRVLVLGGTFEGGFGTATSNIDIYNPATGTFRQVANLVLSRRDHTATLLQDGTVLVVGGQFDCCNTAQNALRQTSAEVYDPVANIASLTPGNLNVPRSRVPSAVTLNDARALVTGGGPGTEIYNPLTELFTLVSNSIGGDRTTLLQDGRVLISAGDGVRIFNPPTNTFTTVTTLFNQGGHTSTRLQDGRVLLAGGVITDFPATRTAFLFIP